MYLEWIHNSACFLYKKIFTFRGQGLKVAPHELGHGMIVLCQAAVHLHQTWQALQKKKTCKTKKKVFGDKTELQIYFRLSGRIRKF